MKLHPGEIICDKCEGSDDFCDKCNGTGKLDWIENIVGVKKFSSLDNINTRLIINHIKKNINCLEPFDLKNRIDIILNNFKLNKVIYDYKINTPPYLNQIDIFIKLNKIIEFIHLNIKIQGDKV